MCLLVRDIERFTSDGGALTNLQGGAPLCHVKNLISIIAQYCIRALYIGVSDALYFQVLKICRPRRRDQKTPVSRSGEAPDRLLASAPWAKSLLRGPHRAHSLDIPRSVCWR
jgi:hypothetical protein